jgi:Terpene synthase family 2, C-terminal metal binding
MKAYKQASVEYFEHQLLSRRDYPDLSKFTPELQKALQSWDEVGSHIRECCSKGGFPGCIRCTLLIQCVTLETRAFLLETMLLYIASVSNVDSIFSGGSIPSLEDYWERRECTAAVYSVIATIPYIHRERGSNNDDADSCRFVFGSDIAEPDIRNPMMQQLWKHTSYICHMYVSQEKKVAIRPLANSSEPTT